MTDIITRGQELVENLRAKTDWMRQVRFIRAYQLTTSFEHLDGTSAEVVIIPESQLFERSERCGFYHMDIFQMSFKHKLQTGARNAHNNEQIDPWARLFLQIRAEIENNSMSPEGYDFQEWDLRTTELFEPDPLRANALLSVLSLTFRESS